MPALAKEQLEFIRSSITNPNNNLLNIRVEVWNFFNDNYEIPLCEKCYLIMDRLIMRGCVDLIREIFNSPNLTEDEKKLILRKPYVYGESIYNCYYMLVMYPQIEVINILKQYFTAADLEVESFGNMPYNTLYTIKNSSSYVRNDALEILEKAFNEVLYPEESLANKFQTMYFNDEPEFKQGTVTQFCQGWS